VAFAASYPLECFPIFSPKSFQSAGPLLGRNHQRPGGGSLVGSLPGTFFFPFCSLFFFSRQFSFLSWEFQFLFPVRACPPFSDEGLNLYRWRTRFPCHDLLFIAEPLGVTALLGEAACSPIHLFFFWSRGRITSLALAVSLCPFPKSIPPADSSFFSAFPDHQLIAGLAPFPSLVQAL